MYWNARQKPRLHLIGIGGTGMSGIAEVLLASGFSVTGSDINKTKTTERLEQLGARIFYGHSAEHIEKPNCVVISSAVQKDNPEWQEAVQQGIPVIQRAEMLAELMRLKKGVAVAGSHGKTTTTSMLGQLLRPLDPTVVVGGRLQHWNASSIVGRGSTFVIEADESDRSFLKFSAVYSLVTNIDSEHLDNYQNFKDLLESFIEFLNSTAFFGMNWINMDCPNLQKIKSAIKKPTKTYGFNPEADLQIKNYHYKNSTSLFEIQFEDKHLGEFVLPVCGRHNVSNAAGAIGMALSLGLPPAGLKRRLKRFIPADRRLQIHFASESAVVVEDYAHHPTEIRASLEAISLMYPDYDRVLVFQPHRYSRTKALWSEFVECLKQPANSRLMLLPIYSAHENEISEISSINLAQEITGKVEVMTQLPSTEEVLQFAESSTRSKLIYVIMGAAPLSSLAHSLAEILAQRGINLLAQQ